MNVSVYRLSINRVPVIKLVLTLGIVDVPKMSVAINGETALYLVTISDTCSVLRQI